jgi:hypothetical protein
VHGSKNTQLSGIFLNGLRPTRAFHIRQAIDIGPFSRHVVNSFQNKSINISILTIVGLMTLFSNSAVAQEGHYWTLQFGTKSTFLGGAVVGSAVDASANFYNPGAVSMLDDEISFQGTAVYLWETLAFQDNTAGVDTEDYSEIKSVPNFLGGVLDVNVLGAVRLGYSIFGRHSYKLGLGSSRADSVRTVDRFDGPQKFVGSAARSTEVRDDWYGLTLAYRLAPNIGIGFSPFVSVRSLKAAQESLRADVLASPTQNATTSLSRKYSFTVYSVLMKMGVYYDGRPFSLGLAVTTPSLAVAGSGSVRAGSTIFNQDVNGNGDLETVLAVLDEENQSARYRTPFAISVGASWKADTRTVYFSAEWYNKVAPFNPIESDPIAAKFRAQSMEPDLLIESKPVLNFSVGLEQRLSSRAILYFSALTDFSAIAESKDVLISMADRDLFHITAGSSLTISRLTLTTGLGIVYGKESSGQSINFFNPHESNILLGDPRSEDVQYRGLKMIVGIELAPAPPK